MQVYTATLSIKVPPSMLEDIKLLAGRYDMTVSAFVRDILSQQLPHLEFHTPEYTEPTV